MMNCIVFLVAILFNVVLCHLALGEEILVADLERSYVLETEISAVVTVHGSQWVLRAEFPRSEVLGAGRLTREVTLQPTRAQFHIGPHVDVAFRVPAGPRVPPALLDHVSYEATNFEVRFAPSPDPRRRELLVRLTPFVANGKTYRVKGPAGDEDQIPLLIRVPLP
jgi:hypothetical protein